MKFADVNSNTGSFSDTILEQMRSTNDIEYCSYRDKYDSTEVKYYEKSSNNIILYDNILLNKYFNKIKNSCTKYLLTKEENIIYRFRPEALSKDKYGTPNLWYVILKVNGCEDFSEFNDFDYVLLPDIGVINECLVDEEYILRKNNK